MIGKKVGEIGKTFGMNIYANTKIKRDLDGATYRNLDDMLNICQIVSLHLPLYKSNAKMANKEFFSKMKKGSYFINTSRGGLVDEFALADALNNEYLRGAGLDVLSTEPPTEDNPLFYSKNTLITPHVAWASKTSRKRLIRIISENIKGYLTNNLQNLVN